ncbi:MAG: Gfo/Idh/MocA family oxidoreductase [Bryobacterales bacterium]|nr:Gfo/Idh/MocA family oxidoreductase [Bryobacteraceae bacterium]MDW8355485.1 Gfo/Idh/MocA family oxidoreductase [Bryobacterales bacterium]
MNRRTFLGAAAAAQVLGANERIRVGLIGAGGRGRLLAGEFKEIGAEVTAVCDVYQPNLEAGLKVASSGARSYWDYRRLLEDKSLDAVIVATPDHWHAQMVIDAVEAGKDVYVEKPLAHTIEEGFRIVEATRRTRRVVQVGTQRRSFDLFYDAKGVMDSGALGPVRLVNSWWLNRTVSLRTPELAGELDWAQWLGPAPKRPLDPVRFFNWYWFWDYSGGMLVGQAAHVVDVIQWFMRSSDPVAVTCAAAPSGIPGAEVPETCSMAVEFPQNYLAVFTLGYQAMRYHPFHDQLVQFHGTKARLDVGRESYAVYPESQAVELRPSLEVRKPGTFAAATRSHVRNFLECIRSRKDPNATVEMGQATNIVLCMAMEALRTGKRVRWDPAARRMAT